MSQPRLLGEVMKEYLINSDDEYARAFRKLFEEHNSDFLVPNNEEDTGNDQ